jgi:hypothetical protein
VFHKTVHSILSADNTDIPMWLVSEISESKVVNFRLNNNKKGTKYINPTEIKKIRIKRYELKCTLYN